MKQCIYAGVFDPPHLGHENIIDRLLGVFDEVTVAVLVNAQKKTLLDEASRAKLLQSLYEGQPRVKIKMFEGLLTDFCQKEGIFTVARGLRGGADFEYEKNLAALYTSQNPAIELIYLGAMPALAHISSTAVKELVKLGGNISDMVNAKIHEEIERSYRKDGFV